MQLQIYREYPKKNEISGLFVQTIPLTIHCDGKLIPALMSEDKIIEIIASVLNKSVHFFSETRKQIKNFK